MRRISLIALAVIVLSLVFVSFGSAQQKTPVYGGVFRLITNNTPQMMSYVPMMGPGDRTAIFPAAEALIDTTTERQTTVGLEPVLAEKVTEDPKKLTITFHIRKGVKFHDGSELTADVARWNIQQVVPSSLSIKVQATAGTGPGCSMSSRRSIAGRERSTQARRQCRSSSSGPRAACAVCTGTIPSIGTISSNRLSQPACRVGDRLSQSASRASASG